MDGGLWKICVLWRQVCQCGKHGRHVSCVLPEDNMAKSPCLPRPSSIERTFNIGFGVFKISTAHSMRVFGGSTTGTTGSSSLGTSVSAFRFCSFVLGCGGGSANSRRSVRRERITKVITISPSETVRNSTTLQPVPSEGAPMYTFSTPSSSRTSTG